MNYLERLVERYPALDGMKDTIEEAFQIMKASYENGGKLLVCGNGGSASDSDHIVGELMKGFQGASGASFFWKRRPGICRENGHMTVSRRIKNELSGTFGGEISGFGRNEGYD